MRVEFHPAFAGDVIRSAARYEAVATRLGGRFRREIDEAIAEIKAAPTAAGHLLLPRPVSRVEFRRRNLRAFPNFVLYGLIDDRLIFGSVIASRSDPLLWLARFGKR